MELVFGIVAGIISGLGMGGGAVLILLLTLFCDINQQFSQGTNLIFFIPTSIISIIFNIKNKNIIWRVAWSVIGFGIIGSVIGSIIAMKISANDLKKYFGIFLIFITVYEIYAFYNLNIKNRKNK